MRPFGYDWCLYNFIYDINYPLAVKIVSNLMYFVSMIWVYQIVNKLMKLICNEFSGILIFIKIAQLLKNLRKYSLLINLLIGLFSFRYFLEYYGITDMPVNVFGKC